MPTTSKPTRENGSRRTLGMITRIYREFVTGGDAFFTVIKAAVAVPAVVGLLKTVGGVLAGTSLAPETVTNLGQLLSTALLPAAPWIILATVAGSLIYIGFGIKDELDRNAEEDKKLELLKVAEAKEQVAAAHVQQNLERRLKNKHLTTLPSPEDDFEAIPDLKSLDKYQLLKFYLWRYLQTRGLATVPLNELEGVAQKKRRLNGTLPGQAGAIARIENILGYSRHHPQFATILAKHFAQDNTSVKAPNDLTQRLTIAFKLNAEPETPENPIHIHKIPKPKGGFRRVITYFKAGFLIAHRGNTGLGLIVWCASVAGILSVSIPFTWPLWILTVGVGIASGIISHVYKKSVDKAYRKNMESLSSNIKKQQTRLDILRKLDKIHVKDYQKLSESVSSNYSDCWLTPDAIGTPTVNPTIAAAEQRAKSQVTLQSSYGTAVGMVIGISITGVTSIFRRAYFVTLGLPGLVITGAGALFAVIFGARYGIQMRKAAQKATQDEINRLRNIEDRQKVIEENVIKDKDFKWLSLEQQQEKLKVVRERLSKSVEELVQELIQNFNKLYRQNNANTTSGLVNRLNETTAQTLTAGAALVDEQEKLLSTIEEATGIRRAVDRVTHLPKNDDFNFYKNLSLFLQGNEQTKNSANSDVSQLREIITKEQDKVVVVRPKDPWYSGFSINGVSRFFHRHFVSCIGAMGIGFPLGMMLFGIWALVPVGTIFTGIMGIYGLYKYYEKQQIENLNKITDKETKLPLVELAVKLKAKVDQKSSSRSNSHDGPNSSATIIKNISQMESVYLDRHQRGLYTHATGRGTSEVDISSTNRAIVETFKRKPASKFLSAYRSEAYISDIQTAIEQWKTARSPSAVNLGSSNSAQASVSQVTVP